MMTNEEEIQDILSVFEELKSEIKQLKEYIDNLKKMYEHRIDLQLKSNYKLFDEIEQLKEEMKARENQFNILINKCNEYENTIIELSEVNGRLVRLVDKQERLINKLKNYVLKEE